MAQIEFGSSVAFRMRAFRFTSTGASGDNNDQVQNISCDIKLIQESALSSTMPDYLSHDCRIINRALDAFDFFCPVLRVYFTSQMPPCDCFTEAECNAQLSSFTPGECTGDYDCDNDLNICSYGDGEEGVCENCENLRTAQACQDGVKTSKSVKLGQLCEIYRIPYTV